MRNKVLLYVNNKDVEQQTGSRFTMPVRGDNSRALASGLSYIQLDKHG